MVDVNLVFPRSDIPHGDFRVPLGISYLSSSLKQAGYSVRCQDLNFEDLDLDCKYIGVSLPTFCFSEAEKIAQEAKSKDIITIAGGLHAYIDPQSLLEAGFDYIIIGDGEKPLVDLIRVLEKGQPYPRVSTYFEKDLDTLAFPDFEWVDREHYVPKTISISTSRDCPFRCSFCIRAIRTWRARSAENIIEEIRLYQGKIIEIVDDCFTLNKERIFRLRKLIKKEHLDVEFSLMNGVRVDTLDHEVIHALIDMNTRNINIGVESTDPEVLAFSNKGITIEAVEECIRLLKKHGYKKNMTIYMIIGLPWDTLQKSLYSIRWAKKQKVLSAWCLATPFPKTPLFDWVNENATWLMDPKDYANYAGTYSKLNVMFETGDFTKSERLYAIKEAKIIGK